MVSASSFTGVAVAARMACQRGLINIQLRLSQSKNPACRELIHIHHSHFVGLQKVQYFFLLDLHKIIKRKIKKITLPTNAPEADLNL